MSTPDTYDVAVIGYGPTGATAANLLGQLGMKVLVVDRDPDVYNRARAISTDEEVMRIWQSVGLADRLQQDMLPDRPLNFVDAAGVPFIELKIAWKLGYKLNPDWPMRHGYHVEIEGNPNCLAMPRSISL